LVVPIGDAEEIKSKAGDKVSSAKYSETNLKLDSKEFILMECNDVLARLLNELGIHLDL
jgi:thioredoxin 1